MCDLYSPHSGAVRLNPSTSDASNKATESAIKDWLKFAKQRNGGRKEREQRKKQDKARESTSNCSDHRRRESTSMQSDHRLECEDFDNE